MNKNHKSLLTQWMLNGNSWDLVAIRGGILCNTIMGGGFLGVLKSNDFGVPQLKPQAYSRDWKKPLIQGMSLMPVLQRPTS